MGEFLELEKRHVGLTDLTDLSVGLEDWFRTVCCYTLLWSFPRVSQFPGIVALDWLFSQKVITDL